MLTGSIATLLSVEEYLATDFQDGDREYVDGSLVGRTVGEFEHGNLQTSIAFYLRAHYQAVVITVVEVRVQVKPSRFRVPDVSVIPRRPSGAVITEPPHIVVEVLSVEVLSKDHRIVDREEKVKDYLDFGIANIWVLNPTGKSASIHSRSGVQYARDGFLRAQNPTIDVELSRIFS